MLQEDIMDKCPFPGHFDIVSIEWQHEQELTARINWLYQTIHICGADNAPSTYQLCLCIGLIFSVSIAGAIFCMTNVTEYRNEFVWGHSFMLWRFRKSAQIPASNLTAWVWWSVFSVSVCRDCRTLHFRVYNGYSGINHFYRFDYVIIWIYIAASR